MAIAECGLSLAGDLPVLGHYYSMMGRGVLVDDQRKYERLKGRYDRRQLETGFDFLARGLHYKFAEPSEIARESFALAFDIWPDLQRAMEAEYQRFTPSWGKNPVVDDVVNMFDLTHLGK
jgi:hypothetical protein